MNLWLVRHPAVTVPSGVVTGQAEVPLAPGYESWLEALSQLIPRAAPVWSSPLSRCRLVGRSLVARRRDAESELIEDPRIQEISFGSWEGKLWDEVPRQEFQQWESNLVDYRPPGGESLREFSGRVQEALDAAALCFSGEKPVVWVTHGGVIRVVIMAILRAPLTEIAALQIDLGSISRIQIQGAVRKVLAINTCVLSEAAA